MKRKWAKKKEMSNELSFEKSGGFGKTPWREGVDQDEHADGRVEDRLDEERGGDGRIARPGDRGLREEQLDDVAAASRDDVVEADRRDVGAPDPPPLEADRGIGRAEAVEEGARADRQVGAEEQQAEHQRRPVHGREVAEELPDGFEERVERLAERCRDGRREHRLNVREPTPAIPRERAFRDRAARYRRSASRARAAAVGASSNPCRE